MTDRSTSTTRDSGGTTASEAAASSCEVVLHGIGAAPGIAIGPIYLYARDAFEVEQRSVGTDGVEQELRRFEQAVAKSDRDLHKIASVAREKLGENSASIFEAQALMLKDDALYGAVVERIRQQQVNADYAVHMVMSKHRQLLMASDNEYLRERADDMLDLQERLIRHLRRGKLLSKIDHDTVVVAENLTAADIILFSRRGILGVAIDFGGATSHVSIMARALGVPAVVSLHGITKSVSSGDLIIIDGVAGRVIIRPEAETLAYYEARQKRYARLLQDRKQLVPLPARTQEGVDVRLEANLEFQEELGLLKEFGAEGVGLFRTEILVLMQRRISLTEDEQYKIYRGVVDRVSPHETTFRVLDLGGDKMLPLGHREHNPFLGWRGVRVLLDRPELLEPQLRAILRASAHGPARLLVPMVTNISDVHRFRASLERVKTQLREEGIAFDEAIPVGIMVEVPSVALQAERFAREVDFFSIGTNDLTQYTLAVDRGNDLVADRYEELHPSVLQLIALTVRGAAKSGLRVGVCGEMAARPEATPILLGLGIRELSASPTYLPEMKRVIRMSTIREAEELAAEALQAADGAAVADLVHAWLEARGLDLLHTLEQEPSSGEAKAGGSASAAALSP